MPTGPSEHIFDSNTFRAEREDDWRRLENLLRRAETRRLTSLSDDDLADLPILYRSALSSLSVARSTSLDVALVSYLEALCTRAYFFIYGVRTGFGQLVRQFLRSGWPGSVRELWVETLVAFGLIFAGVVAGYLLVAGDPQWFHAIIPAELAQGRDPEASTETLRQTLFDRGEDGGFGVFAAALFTHNAQIAIFAFALGFAFGVPTALLLLYNGATLGAFIALFAERGLGLELGGWLIIHGSTEFFAIVLAGAAGFHVARRIAFPGRHSRLAAARFAGRRSARVMIGGIAMFLVAGLLEGFARQLVDVTVARYAIGAAMLALWYAYFYLPVGNDGRD